MSILPEQFIERLLQIAPALDPQQAFAKKRFVAFRVNTLKTTMATISGWMQENHIQVEEWSVFDKALIINENDANQVKSSTFVQSGEIYPQGLHSMLPVVVLNPQENDKILDLCAAPGSKASQIAAQLKGTGELTANEAVKDRFYKLKSVMALTGSMAQLTMVDGRRFEARSGLFDKILVDAPCSSEGRFCLNDPKSVGFWSVRKIHECAHKQKGLLLNAARLLKPGGTLVYSTCTYAPEENEAVVDWLLRKDDTLDLAKINLPAVKSYPAISQWNDKVFDARISRCLRVSPDEKLEGFFIAKFIKSHYK